MDTEETSIYIAVLITCLIVIVLITVFTTSIIRAQRKKLELARQNMLIEISTMERERSRIATDLHDDLGPVLSVVKFQIDNVTVADSESVGQLQNASRQIDESIQKLREISNNLMPSSLLRKGLFVSIKEFIRSLDGAGGTKITLNNDTNVDVPQELSMHIYRIIKEILHNGLKHAKASEITLNCKDDHNELSIHYIDNGTGFDIEKTIQSSLGFGLRNLKSRVEIMGGTMVSESSPGKGTAFLFKFPIK